MKMVKKIDNKFQCGACDMFYNDEKYALECEDFCKKNNACNIDIIKHAVE